MAQTLKGLGFAVNFGFQSTSSDGGVTSTNLTGYFLQSSELKMDAQIESVHYLQGDTGSQNYYDQQTDATLTFVISATTRAGAITATSIKTNFQPGVIISITACASNPDLVNSYWIVQPGSTIPQEITKSAEFRLILKNIPNITAAQS
jgi:hypothetical protein